MVVSGTPLLDFGLLDNKSVGLLWKGSYSQRGFKCVSNVVQHGSMALPLCEEHQIIQCSGVLVE